MGNINTDYKKWTRILEERQYKVKRLAYIGRHTKKRKIKKKILHRLVRILRETLQEI